MPLPDTSPNRYTERLVCKFQKIVVIAADLACRAARREALQSRNTPIPLRQKPLLNLAGDCQFALYHLALSRFGGDSGGQPAVLDGECGLLRDGPQQIEITGRIGCFSRPAAQRQKA
jgi:hypothetical protein